MASGGYLAVHCQALGVGHARALLLTLYGILQLFFTQYGVHRGRSGRPPSTPFIIRPNLT